MGIFTLSISKCLIKEILVTKVGIIDDLINSFRFFIDCGKNFEFGKLFLAMFSHIPKLFETRND